MTRSTRGSRRSALLLAGMAASGLLLSACSAGQVAETAETESSIQGVNIAAESGEYGLRGLLVAYPGVDGYQAGDDANLNVTLYNDSRDTVRVTVTTEDALDVVITEPTAPMGEGPSATPAGTESPAPDAATPPAGQPAQVEVPPLGYVQLNSAGSTVLRLIGLNESLRSGQNVYLTFDFDGTAIRAAAPVSVPLTPAPPPAPIIERETGFEKLENGHGGEGGGH
ncbi:hypothetical protein [Salinispora arenicola]|uniref:Copper(I)-binding protein n=1 Tax=Salinispora arenicola TaxID=168697 RepID=A0A542XL86_SALAC|nr:hypothetical protein [Salinispora arenicola]MCN0154951.1 hypothetical protein [Salinispora arenicola]TQL36615.1 hypothetical protein FB564_1719 [Salinispora arenicola]GIM87632.1 hypothetical protein Sar04_43680 [Salinispora arenicola]